MRYSYYQRLSEADRRTYRKSDAVTTLELPDIAALHPLVARLRAALESGRRAETERAARGLCDALAGQLSVPGMVVKVRARRPKDGGGELHGLYTYEDGVPPQIEVWMRTAAHERVVAFRTFLRTLLHEVAHHLDLSLLKLPDTFHTEGFFRRESSLTRQLAPTSPRRRAQPAVGPKPVTRPAKRPRTSRTRERRQLSLFEETG